ncbi:MAG: cytochrome c [Rhodothermales bacterium]
MRYLSLTFVPLFVLYAAMAFQMPKTSTATSRNAADTTLAARISRGAELFSRTCQRCHNPRGPAERTDREWVIIMQHMQTRATLTRRQASLVREFLLASNDADQAPGRERRGLQTPANVTEEMIEQGRIVYHGAGTCSACHGDALQGGPIAPNLNDDRWQRASGDYASILNVVRNGVSGTAMAAYPGGITDEQAQQVAAYVWAVAGGRTEP